MRPDADSSIVVDDRPPAFRWRYVVGAFALATLLRFSYFYFDDLARQVHGTLLVRLIEEVTGNVASALLFPVAVVAERRFPLDRGRWRRAWPAHFLSYVLYSVAHTTIIAGLRAVVFPLAGQGPYDYGSMPARYIMESAQDFFSYVMFVGVLTLIRVQQHLRAKERRALELERDAANARLESLSLRLQPHFLFNALNTISSTAYQDPVATDELIGRLGELLRQSLRTTEHQEIPLAEELSVLHAYQALVEARFGERVRFAFDVDPATAPLGVPAFLLQPLVENAVQHGAALEYGNTNITIHAFVRNDTLVVVVENDSPATFDAAKTGTGLGTTRDRLALLYGDGAELEINGDGAVFRVTVRVPAHVVPPSLTIGEENARAHR